MSDTRHRIMVAFRDLAIEYGYSAISVRDIIARADVARSTFYETFESKGDGFRVVAQPILEPLADACLPISDRDRLLWVLNHIREVRGARSMLEEPSRGLLARELGDLIESRLETLRAPMTVAPMQPLSLVAAWIAEAEIGSITAWLDDAHPVAVETVATLIQTAASSCAQSFTRA